MKVSLNWMREFTAITQPKDQLIYKIGAQIGAVEEVTDLGASYQGIVIAKVVSCVKHPNADKLHVCLIDGGKVTKGVKRDKDGLVEVVCGAPNVKAGLLVVWIPPGATVPSTVDRDPFVLEARKLRGVVSNGMLASAKELAIGDSHEGLLIIEKGKPGDDFAKTFWLDDLIIDIENKMFTHRPDCFGQLGVAREIAGIIGQSFKSPDWYKQEISLGSDGRKNVLDLKVINDVPKLVPRFTAVAIKDVKIGPSPAWMQSFLIRVGVKPINNIVDVTNFVMLETGQPLHAYDYDKLKTNKLGARLSKDGEELKLLGGKNLKLKAGSVVITDGQKPIGLGGIMGGAETEVGDDTTNIVLECANFNMNCIRRSAMEYGLFTDAATRFTKGQSPLQNMASLVRAANLITQMFGGRVASKVIDQAVKTVKADVVTVDVKFINDRLGLDLGAHDITKLLKNVEFDVKLAGSRLTITAPFWRTDIEIPEDIVEEVGRLYGYDHLPLELPGRNLTPAKLNGNFVLKNTIRQILTSAGASEVLTYSFVDENLIQKAGQDKSDTYHLRNALSPDLRYYRLSLTPSLLDKIHPNIKDGFDKFMLFELGRAHVKGVLDGEKLPKKLDRLVLVRTKASFNKEEGAPYFAIKKHLENLLHRLGINSLDYQLLAGKLDKQWRVAAQAYEPNRSAVVIYKDTILGLIGEPTQHLKQSLKLPVFTAQAEIDVDALLIHAQSLKYHPLNRFPSVEQDLCLRTKAGIAYGELTDFISATLSDLAKEHGYITSLEPLDIYQSEKDKNHKQTTWHITVAHPSRTLTTQEINKLLDRIVDKAKVKFKAERV